MKKVTGIILTSTILVYLFYKIFLVKNFYWQGCIAFILISLVWGLPYLPRPQRVNGRFLVLIALIYYILRLAFNLLSMYVLFSYKILTIYEILGGYFILLLISFINIKKDKNLGSPNQ